MSNSLGMAADIPKYFKNVWDSTSLQLLPTEHVDVWASVSMNEEKRYSTWKLKINLQYNINQHTLCFPFILQVSTSACLDFHVNFYKERKRQIN